MSKGLFTPSTKESIPSNCGSHKTTLFLIKYPCFFLLKTYYFQLWFHYKNDLRISYLRNNGKMFIKLHYPIIYQIKVQGYRCESGIPIFTVSVLLILDIWITVCIETRCKRSLMRSPQCSKGSSSHAKN